MLLIDSDAFILLATSGYLNRLAHLLGIPHEEVRRLGPLPHMLRGKKMCKAYPTEIRELVIAVCENVAELDERAEDPDFEQRLLDVPDIDSGEAELYALLAERPHYYLVSNDKRAMRALARTDEVSDIRNMIAGRVVCLQAALRMLIENDDFGTIATAFTPLRECETTIRVIFSRGEETDREQCVETVNSYFDELDGQVGIGFLYSP
ncbi:MAG: hypothetical protein WD534_10030 [Phycisphaeraceae bacterium]